MKASIHKNQRMFGIATFLALLFMADVAEAQYGAAHRATRRRTAVVVSTATHAKDEQAAEEQAAQEQAAQEQAAQPEESAQPEQAAEPVPATQPEQAAVQGDHLPYGTIVTALPEKCDPVVVDDVQYYHCGNDYYRTAYQENNLVYVTIEPPK